MDGTWKLAMTFLVAGVWEGRYEDHDYDTCSHFFGSGLKISNNELIAVPSTGLVTVVVFVENRKIDTTFQTVLLKF